MRQEEKPEEVIKGMIEIDTRIPTEEVVAMTETMMTARGADLHIAHPAEDHSSEKRSADFARRI